MDDRDLRRLVARFDTLLPDLLQGGNENRWAVISDDGLVCIDSDFGHACETGRSKLDGRPFVVQQVLPRDRVAIITRLRTA
jgi:hypothetical protein